VDEVSLNVSSWTRFVVQDLTVTPDLIGLSHEFAYGGHQISVRLPPKTAIPLEACEGDLLSFNVYREIEGKQVPQYFWVKAVDVIVHVPEPVSAPKGVLDTPPNAYEMVPATKQAELNSLTQSCEAIAEKAFDLWIRVLRWESDNAAIGRPEVIGHESGWSTYLLVTSTNQRMWASPSVIEARGGKPITAREWKRVESALRAELKPPVFLELLFDAIEHIKLGDIRRAIVDMAVACETYLRMVVADSLPAHLSAAIRQYVDDANIRSVLTRFIPEILNDQERTQLGKIQSRLHSLFDCRNEILHFGRLPDNAADDCEAYLEATRRLFQIKHRVAEGTPPPAG
jgi:hypothetical protein